jgi:phloretin hydrolase
VPSLEDYLSRPLSPPDPAVLEAVEGGPIDPGRADSRDDVDALLDPAALPQENGWCLLPDGCGYVAIRSEMPGVSGEMVDWWFDWHPRDPIRYRVWHPLAHEHNRLEPAASPGEKPYWDTVHHPVEDIGTGTVHARISFVRPQSLGFGAGALDRPDVAAIVGGFAGDDRRRMQHTKMVHVFLRSNGGVALRSRFWLGAALRPYAPKPLADLGAALLNRPAVRRRLLPKNAARALARHCAEEYANLAALLPELYERFGPDVPSQDA